MAIRASRLLLASIGLALLSTAASAADTAAPPLIARAKLFGNPEKAAAQISPDGKWLLWLAPRDGVLNVWVAPTSDPSKAKPLTAEKTRPIRSALWAPDSTMALYVNDKGGDENFQLYGVDVATGAERTFTNFPKARVVPVGISHHVKDRILIGINNRDPKWHDVYSLDLASGKLTPVFQNDGYAGFLADDDLNVRLASKARADGGMDYYRVADGDVAATPIVSFGLDDSLTTAPVGFTNDGNTLYWLDSRNRDTAALMAQDVATGAMTVIGESPKADIGGALVDPRTGVVQAYNVDYLKDEYVPVGDAVASDLAFLKAQNKGQFYVTAQTDDNSKWLVAFDPVTAPSSTWLYDRAGKTLTELFVSRPELAGAPLVPMWPEEIEARDGLTLVSYLTLPKGADANADGRADHPVPMVLFVHGGPWGRDDYGYFSYHQWLANRGYAVLSVNFRGSTGFGKKFISAGDLEWGRKMHDDLLDAVAWAVDEGVTTKDKVAIMGGSYGGYATLAGMAFTPDTFACGVDIVGPSNLFTLLETIPPYWEAGKQQFYKRMGDPTTEEGRALLKERSPLFAADRITHPLLIAAGANDPRVNVRESNQIVAAMAAKNIPVTYVLFPDEGHGFARPENNIAFNAVAENFLAPCLGGRAEPIGGAFAASSGTVEHGAEGVPGLVAAIGGK
jgi:dipeptidyl aminopeptidase/acylaminoacyl peptidase